MKSGKLVFIMAFCFAVLSESAAAEPQQKRNTSKGDRITDSERGDRTAVRNRAPVERSRHRFEFGILPRHSSNLFQATAGAPQVGAWILSAIGRLESDLVRTDTSVLTGGFSIARNIYRGVEGANSYDLDATMDYRFGRNEFEFAYFATPRKLAFIVDNQKGHHSVSGVEFGYTRYLKPRVEAQVGYERVREDYDRFNDRDSVSHEFSTGLRYHLHTAFVPGIGIELERRTAASDNFSRSEVAPLLLLKSRMGRRVWATLRYRYRSRDYRTANRAFPNFGREDRRHDFSGYANLRLNDHWWIFVSGSYLDQDSTRARRTFTGHELGAGLFYRLP